MDTTKGVMPELDDDAADREAYIDELELEVDKLRNALQRERELKRALERVAGKRGCRAAREYLKRKQAAGGDTSG